MNKKLCLLIIVLFLCCGCGKQIEENQQQNKDYSIKASEVFSMIDEENTYIIDVREESEYSSGHIEKAINIPLNTISSDLIEEIPLDSKVIVYCQSGNRSRLAIVKLNDLGYENLFDLGGINNWTYDIVTD